jgi:hypothetical protein
MSRLLLTAFLCGIVLAACQTAAPPAPTLSGNDPLMDPTPTPTPIAAPSADGTPTAVPSTSLGLANNQRFRDVPLPVGAKEDPRRNYVYESEMLQVGRLVYKTKASVNDLTNFYLKECPAADWKLKHALQTDGTELTFLKPGKRLVVTIRPEGAFASHRVLFLNLTPDNDMK